MKVRVIILTLLLVSCFIPAKNSTAIDLRINSNFLSRKTLSIKAVSIDTIKVNTDAIIDKSFSLKAQHLKAAAHSTDDVWNLLSSSINTINETYKFAHSQRLEKEKALLLADKTNLYLQTVLKKQDHLEDRVQEMNTELQSQTQVVDQFKMANIFLNLSVDIAFTVIILFFLIQILLSTWHKKNNPEYEI